MKHIVSLSIILTITSLSSMHGTDKAIEQINPVMPHADGMYYTTNNFGDIFPQWDNIPLEQLSQRLSSFVNALKDSVKETPFILEVPHEKAAAIEQIKKAGFSFYYANNEKSEWIFKNNSSIPAPYTTHASARIIIRKEDMVLVMEEKTRPGLLDFPAGGADTQELLRTTAARELKEEINLDVDPENFKLCALFNRKEVNRFKANGTDYCYVVDHSQATGDLKINPSEVVRVFYVPLQDIAEQTSIDGLTVFPAVAALARHLLNKNSLTHHETFLDYRQLSKKESEQDLNDTMILEFFAQ